MTKVVGQVSASTVQSQAGGGIAQSVTSAVSSDKFVFWAGLDGTNNIASNLDYSGDAQSTAIGALSKQITDAGATNTAVKYYPGVGTPNNGGFLASVVPVQAAENTVRNVLADYAKAASDWLALTSTES